MMTWALDKSLRVDWSTWPMQILNWTSWELNSLNNGNLPPKRTLPMALSWQMWLGWKMKSLSKSSCNARMYIGGWNQWERSHLWWSWNQAHGLNNVWYLFQTLRRNFRQYLWFIHFIIRNVGMAWQDTWNFPKCMWLPFLHLFLIFLVNQSCQASLFTDIIDKSLIPNLM